MNNVTLSAKPTRQRDTPVLFIIFNRPDTTRQVFEAIKMARPARLYVAADGPRENVAGEEERCLEVRRIVEGVDWSCEVKTLFSTTNMGCGKGPCTAINWFFEHETEGIILEDDCLPSQTFFGFCSELLQRYRYDTRVMEIGGNNFDDEHLYEEDSYRFSNHIYIWGWATWKRAWKFHDFHMRQYPEIEKYGYLDASYDTIYERDYYEYVFKKMHTGDEVTNSRTIWDYQWQFACKINSGLIIVPNRNLVQNLGFGDHATNTLNPRGVGHNLKIESMTFPLKHPEFIMADAVKDKEVFRKVSTTWTSRLKSQAKSIIPKKIVESVLKPLMAVFT
jgi:hypothetical protein